MTEDYTNYNRDPRGFILPTNEKMCVVAALMMKAAVLEDNRQIVHYKDLLTTNEKHRVFFSCLNLLRSLGTDISVDAQAYQGEIKQLEKRESDLIQKLAERDEVLKQFGVDLTIDKREKA